MGNSESSEPVLSSLESSDTRRDSSSSGFYPLSKAAPAGLANHNVPPLSLLQQSHRHSDTPMVNNPAPKLAELVQSTSTMSHRPNDLYHLYHPLSSPFLSSSLAVSTIRESYHQNHVGTRDHPNRLSGLPVPQVLQVPQAAPQGVMVKDPVQITTNQQYEIPLSSLSVESLTLLHEQDEEGERSRTVRSRDGSGFHTCRSPPRVVASRPREPENREALPTLADRQIKETPRQSRECHVRTNSDQNQKRDEHESQQLKSLLLQNNNIVDEIKFNNDRGNEHSGHGGEAYIRPFSKVPKVPLTGLTRFPRLDSHCVSSSNSSETEGTPTVKVNQQRYNNSNRLIKRRSSETSTTTPVNEDCRSTYHDESNTDQHVIINNNNRRRVATPATARTQYESMKHAVPASADRLVGLGNSRTSRLVKVASRFAHDHDWNVDALMMAPAMEFGTPAVEFGTPAVDFGTWRGSSVGSEAAATETETQPTTSAQETFPRQKEVRQSHPLRERISEENQHQEEGTLTFCPVDIRVEPVKQLVKNNIETEQLVPNAVVVHRRLPSNNHLEQHDDKTRQKWGKGPLATRSLSTQPTTTTRCPTACPTACLTACPTACPMIEQVLPPQIPSLSDTGRSNPLHGWQHHGRESLDTSRGTTMIWRDGEDEFRNLDGLRDPLLLPLPMTTTPTSDGISKKAGRRKGGGFMGRFWYRLHPTFVIGTLCCVVWIWTSILQQLVYYHCTDQVGGVGTPQWILKRPTQIPLLFVQFTQIVAGVFGVACSLLALVIAVKIACVSAATSTHQQDHNTSQNPDHENGQLPVPPRCISHYDNNPLWDFARDVEVSRQSSSSSVVRGRLEYDSAAVAVGIPTSFNPAPYSVGFPTSFNPFPYSVGLPTLPTNTQNYSNHQSTPKSSLGQTCLLKAYCKELSRVVMNVRLLDSLLLVLLFSLSRWCWVNAVSLPHTVDCASIPLFSYYAILFTICLVDSKSLTFESPFSSVDFLVCFVTLSNAMIILTLWSPASAISNLDGFALGPLALSFYHDVALSGPTTDSMFKMTFWFVASGALYGTFLVLLSRQIRQTQQQQQQDQLVKDSSSRVVIGTLLSHYLSLVIIGALITSSVMLVKFIPSLLLTDHQGVQGALTTSDSNDHPILYGVSLTKSHFDVSVLYWGFQSLQLALNWPVAISTIVWSKTSLYLPMSQLLNLPIGLVVAAIHYRYPFSLLQYMACFCLVVSVVVGLNLVKRESLPRSLPLVPTSSHLSCE